MDGSRYAILCGSVGSEGILVSGPGRQGCCPDVLHQDGAESHRAPFIKTIHKRPDSSGLFVTSYLKKQTTKKLCDCFVMLQLMASYHLCSAFQYNKRHMLYDCLCVSVFRPVDSVRGQQRGLLYRPDVVG